LSRHVSPAAVAASADWLHVLFANICNGNRISAFDARMAARSLEQQAPALRKLLFYSPIFGDVMVFVHIQETHGWRVGAMPWKDCLAVDSDC
jgi:hypothetical protein